MNYLIDGHNLIGKMGDISLSDPDDELQLVRRLQKWVTANLKRHVLVIFDGGLRAGKDPHLSSSRLQIFFAPAEQTADLLLLRRIERVKNPAEYTLVTSDQAIIAAATAKRMPVIRSEAFATQMAIETHSQRTAELEELDNPRLTEAEIAEWLTLFGPVPDRPPTPPRPGHLSPSVASAPQTPPRQYTVGEYKAGLAHLSSAEIREWMELFGPVPEPPPPDAPAKKRIVRPAKDKGSAPAARTYKSGQSQLSDAEIEEWLNWFGGEDPSG